jgi:hypothetical protein
MIWFLSRVVAALCFCRKKSHVNLGRVGRIAVAFAALSAFWSIEATGQTITDAQILEGKDGVSLLRVTVSNPTDEARPLSSLTFDASHPKRNKKVKCYKADKAHDLVLRWEKQNTSDKLTAETTLKGVEVPVKIHYRSMGACSDYHMSAVVPLSDSIAANTSKIVSLRLKELPEIRTSSKPVGRIVSWPQKTVSIYNKDGKLVDERRITEKLSR